MAWMADLWARNAEGLWLYVWRRDPSPEIFWTQKPAEADAAVKSWRGSNVYTGVTAAGQAYPQGERIRAERVRGWVGLVADLDVANPRRKKTGHFATKDEAVALLRSLPVMPTYIVDSGSGVHGWWVYREPYLTDTPEEQAEALALSRRWHEVVKAAAAPREVDAVWDAARLMRVPGSVHTAESEARGKMVEAAVIYRGERVNPVDFEPYLPETPETPRAVAVDVAINVEASIDAIREKILSYMEFDHDLADVVEGRREFPSPSERELSLATRLAPILTDQEIVDYLVSENRRPGGKIKHHTYYARTVGRGRAAAIRHGRCRESGAAAPADPPAMAESEPADQPTEAQPDEATKRSLFATIYDYTGLPVSGVTMYGEGQDAEFSVLLKSGESYRLGSAEEVLNWRKWAALSVAEGSGPAMQPKTVQWYAVLRGLKPYIVREAPPGEAEADQTRGWVLGYVQHVLDMGEADAGELGDTISQQAPWTRDGEVYIHLETFRTQHVGQVHRQKLSRPDMMRRLRALGFEVASRISARDRQGKTVCRTYWRVGLAELAG